MINALLGFTLKIERRAFIGKQLKKVCPNGRPSVGVAPGRGETGLATIVCPVYARLGPPNPLSIRFQLFDQRIKIVFRRSVFYQ